MSAVRAIGLSALAVAALGWLTGCSTKSDASERTRSGRPTILRYVHAPSGIEEPMEQTLRLDRLKAYLAERLKVDVELYKTTGGYGATIEAMRAKKIDVATLGPFGYLIASEKAGAEVVVVRGTKETPEGAYSGAIAVRKDSPIQTIDELIARSRELTFSYVDPDSTSGFLVERAFFQSRGLNPDTAFKKTLFSMNHVASAMTLIAGKVDAAAMMETLPSRVLVKRHLIQPGDIRILWVSPRLPSSPIAVRRDLPAAFKEEIRQALLDIPTRAPDLWKMWPKPSGDPDAVLMPGNDAMFDGLRKMARGIENLSLLER
jgi:phosphonate transport system substrate-binding protein